jgi:adapter protein MecA 1/2
MKIEKVNENLRELAYGSDKAKGLFHDMIQQANYEFGFEANDIPLMVEAIPLSAESLLLLITKVEYPDELDTRFSRFSETDADELFEEYDTQSTVTPKGADDILGIFNKLREAKASETDRPHEDFKVPDGEQQISGDLTRMYEFADLEQVERLARTLGGYYTGQNDLYKHGPKNRFYLMVHKNAHTPEEFNRICNIICEYAVQKNYNPAVGAFFSEHGKKITGPWALQTLASL